jgi:hypothetical protein
MATKKQQRRKYQRAQGRGRLYEGYEPQPGSDDSPNRKQERSLPRGARVPARPTWMRSLKRAALFAGGLFLVTQVVPLGGTKNTLAASAVQAASFFVFLVPFGYLMDAFMYNRWLKRQQG